MTADRNELDMTELDPRELMDAAGGAAYDAAVELAKYIEELCSSTTASTRATCT